MHTAVTILTLTFKCKIQNPKNSWLLRCVNIKTNLLDCDYEKRKVLAGQSWRTNPLGPLTQPATIRRWEEGGNFIFIFIFIFIIFVIAMAMTKIMIWYDNVEVIDNDEDLMLPIWWWLVRAIRGKDAKIKSSARPHTISYQNWVGGRSKWESIVFSVFPQFDGSIKHRPQSICFFCDLLQLAYLFYIYNNWNRRHPI